MSNYFIVMGDILNSRNYEGAQLMSEFKDLVSYCNTSLAKGILSPYTITLGDEFQGVAKSLHWSVESLLCLEEYTLRRRYPFLLRYVVHYGEINTRLNRKIAHGMIGPGLTHARELLTDKRRGRARFIFDLPDSTLGAHLGRLFNVMASIMQEWSPKDADLILDMLQNNDNAAIGAKYGKNRSQIWKRRKNLHLDDYKALREMAIELSNEWGMR